MGEMEESQIYIIYSNIFINNLEGTETRFRISGKDFLGFFFDKSNHKSIGIILQNMFHTRF